MLSTLTYSSFFIMGQNLRLTLRRQKLMNRIIQSSIHLFIMGKEINLFFTKLRSIDHQVVTSTQRSLFFTLKVLCCKCNISYKRDFYCFSEIIYVYIYCCAALFFYVHIMLCCTVCFIIISPFLCVNNYSNNLDIVVFNSS